MYLENELSLSPLPPFLPLPLPLPSSPSLPPSFPPSSSLSGYQAHERYTIVQIQCPYCKLCNDI